MDEEVMGRWARVMKAMSGNGASLACPFCQSCTLDYVAYHNYQVFRIITVHGRDMSLFVVFARKRDDVSTGRERCIPGRRGSPCILFVVEREIVLNVVLLIARKIWGRQVKIGLVLIVMIMIAKGLIQKGRIQTLVPGKSGIRNGMASIS